MVRIGKNIKLLREVKGITQDDLAQRVGLHQSDISRLETKDHVEDDLLKRIADALEFPIEVFRIEDMDARISMVFQQSGNLGYVNNFSPVDKLAELYERIIKYEQTLKEKDAQITALEAINATLRQKLSNE